MMITDFALQRSPATFPLTDMPDLIRHAIQALADAEQVAVEAAATVVLGINAAVAQAVGDVVSPVGRDIPLGQFTIVIYPSGQSKTPLINAFLEPLRALQNEFAHDGDMRRKKHAAALDVHREKAEYLRQELRRALNEKRSAAVIELQIEELAVRQPMPPKVPTWILEDVTLPSLQKHLATACPFALCASEEGYRVLDELVGRQPTQVAAAWGGLPPQSLRMERSYSGRDPIRLSILAMVQGQQFGKFLQRRGDDVFGSGVMSRFFVCEPMPTAGYRDWNTARQVSREPINALVERLLTLARRAGNRLVAGEPLRDRLKLSDQAKLVWRQCSLDYEQWIGPGRWLAALPAFGSKCAEHVLRVAGAIAVVESDDRIVREQHMLAASKVVFFFAQEALRLFGPQPQVPLQVQWASELENFLWSRMQLMGGVPQPIAANDILRNGPKNLRRRENLDAATSVLQQQGRIIVAPRPHGSYAVQFYDPAAFMPAAVMPMARFPA
ncbi:DUF3987 domain-containing protein [Thiomonas sp. FB-Cd]|uniref:DUF3987 domain-containing protein n=1 Tax=Thiomonas sp. FB-Cd TaxID=1158292 RepID=UPI0004DFBEDA|nr:DUF3987 domain-containing protein [Thiomonas sp. FB-Cd]